MRASVKVCSAFAACLLAAGMSGCATAGTSGASSSDNSTLDNTSLEQAVEQTFDTVTFGSYKQDGSGSATEPIEWYVLAKEDGKSLLISKYVLDAAPFNDSASDDLWSVGSPRPTVDVEWADSALREWLNGEFFQSAFSSDEQSAIATVTVSDSKSVADQSSSPADSSIHVAKQSDDNVFLLSVSEARSYFANSDARVAFPTDYALAQGAYTGVTTNANGEVDEALSGSAAWWLRTGGYYGGYTSVVTDDGYIHGDGYRSDGELHDGFDNHGTETSELGGNIGVRPCIWVDDSALA